MPSVVWRDVLSQLAGPDLCDSQKNPELDHLLWIRLVAMSGEEKRGFKRLTLPFKGTARFSTNGEREVVAKDISAGSAYLIVPTCPDIGEQVTLLMRWPAEQEHQRIVLDGDGEVLRVDKLSDGSWGCVVKFPDRPNLIWKK